MKVVWSSDAWDDYSNHWCDPQRKRDLKKLNGLIKECRRTPYEGTGSPEELKHQLTGWWSRRIVDEHRLVYRLNAEEDAIEILSCLYHY